MTVSKPEFDEALVPPGILAVLETLMDTADKIDSKDDWMKCFSTTASIWRNGKSYLGTNEIRQMIDQSWENVKWRNHVAHKIFSLGKGIDEFMVDGTTEYHWKDNKVQTGKWAAQFEFTKEHGLFKISKYTVVFAWK